MEKILEKILEKQGKIKRKTMKVWCPSCSPLAKPGIDEHEIEVPPFFLRMLYFWITNYNWEYEAHKKACKKFDFDSYHHRARQLNWEKYGSALGRFR